MLENLSETILRYAFNFLRVGTKRAVNELLSDKNYSVKQYDIVYMVELLVDVSFFFNLLFTVRLIDYLNNRNSQT